MLQMLHSKSCCLFYNEDGDLINFSTKNSEQRSRAIASDLNDPDILCKISNADLVALESKYHFRCLTPYKNKLRSLMRSISRTENVTHKQIKANMLVEVEKDLDRCMDKECCNFPLMSPLIK